MNIFELTKTAPISKKEENNEKISFINVESENISNSDEFFSPYFLFPYMCPNQSLFYFQHHPIPNTEEKNFKEQILEKIILFEDKKIKIGKNKILKIYSPDYFKKLNKKIFIPKISEILISEIIFSNYPKIKKIIFLDKNKIFEKNNIEIFIFFRNKILEKINNGIPILNPKLTYFGYFEKYCFKKCPYKNFCPTII